MSLFSSFLESNPEVTQGKEWVVRVLVTVTDLFQHGAENGMFGPPTRNAFDLGAPKQSVSV